MMMWNSVLTSRCFSKLLTAATRTLLPFNYKYSNDSFWHKSEVKKGIWWTSAHCLLLPFRSCLSPHLRAWNQEQITTVNDVNTKRLVEPEPRHFEVHLPNALCIACVVSYSPKANAFVPVIFTNERPKIIDVLVWTGRVRAKNIVHAFSNCIFV